MQIIDATIPITSIVPENLECNLFAKLYYVKVRGGTNTVGSLEVLSYSKVFKPLINPGTDEASRFLEVTVAGPKNDLDKLLIEYDETSEDGKIRKLFITENDALGDEQAGFCLQRLVE